MSISSSCYPGSTITARLLGNIKMNKGNSVPVKEFLNFARMLCICSFLSCTLYMTVFCCLAWIILSGFILALVSSAHGEHALIWELLVSSCSSGVGLLDSCRRLGEASREADEPAASCLCVLPAATLQLSARSLIAQWALCSGGKVSEDKKEKKKEAEAMDSVSRRKSALTAAGTVFSERTILLQTEKNCLS